MKSDEKSLFKYTLRFDDSESNAEHELTFYSLSDYNVKSYF